MRVLSSISATGTTPRIPKSPDIPLVQSTLQTAIELVYRQNINSNGPWSLSDLYPVDYFTSDFDY